MTPRRSVILDSTVRLVFDAALVLSVYLLFAGHNQPGGGFVGGLVAAAAIALRYIAGGFAHARPATVQPWGMLAAGLALVVGSALVPMFAGSAPLDQTAYSLHPPLFDSVKVTTATVFDTGVYLIVVGLMLMILEGLAGEAADDNEADPA